MQNAQLHSVPRGTERNITLPSIAHVALIQWCHESTPNLTAALQLHHARGANASHKRRTSHPTARHGRRHRRRRSSSSRRPPLPPGFSPAPASAVRLASLRRLPRSPLAEPAPASLPPGPAARGVVGGGCGGGVHGARGVSPRGTRRRPGPRPRSGAAPAPGKEPIHLT